MIKVLMLGNSPKVKGGITTVINQYRNYNWKDNDIEMDFISTYNGGKMFYKIFYFLIAYIKIFLYLLTKKVDIIHIHMSYKGSFTRANMIFKLACLFNRKVVIHLHGSEFKKWYDECNDLKKKKIKNMIKKVECFIVLGDNWKNIIESIEFSNNVFCARNAINIPTESVKFNEKKIFIYTGVLIKRKGVIDLIEVINKIVSKEKKAQFEVMIIGVGEEENNLKNKVKEYKLESYIKFLGWIDTKKIKDYILESNIMVLPSYNEGLPMSILEGISYGLPVISTNVGDISSAVIDGKNGFLYNSGNLDDLLNIINKMIHMPKNEWEAMSKCSKRIAKDNFSDGVYFNEIVKMYKKVMELNYEKK